MSALEEKPQQEIASRRDQLSLWSIILIIGYFVMQGMTMAGHPPSFRHKKSLPTPVPSARTALDSDSGFKNLFEIDYLAKVIYVSDHYTSLLDDSPAASSPTSPKTSAAAKPTRKPVTPVVNSPKPATPASPTSLLGSRKGSQEMTLPGLVKQATDALRDDPLDVDLARRVILLRAENGTPPLDPIPPKGKKPGLSSPLASYAPVAGTPPAVQARFDEEAAVWKDLFSAPTLPKGTDTASFTRRIGALPNLRWYKEIALHQLYLRAGNSALAANAQKEAVTNALESELPLVLILLTMLALLCMGGLLLVSLVVVGVIAWRVGYEYSATKPIIITWFERIAQPRQAPISQEERRLGAGDLMDIFVIYLFTGLAIGFVFDYLVTHVFQRQLASLSYNSTISFDIIAESFAYVLNGLIAYWLLLYIANRRKTSLASELGLSTQRLAKNALFGLAGWSMGLALMTAIGSLTMHVFQNAPEPTNPAVKLEVGSSGFISHFLLFALASVAAPFFEELLFRGVFFQAARLKVGPWPAMLLTGLVFGYAHPVGAGQALALSTLGCVFAWMAYTRKSLVPSMTAHFLQNTFASVVMWLAFLVVPPG